MRRILKGGIGMPTEVEMGVQLIEWFKSLTGFTLSEFLTYMNKNNAWDMLNDAELIKGCIWAEEEDIMSIFGRFLTKDERLDIISRHNG